MIEQGSNTFSSPESRISSALTLLGFLEVSNPTSILNYKTNPSHIFDKTLWPVLRPLMLTKAQGKVTHWWHWHGIPQEVKVEGIFLKGQPNTFSLENPNKLIRTLNLIRMSLGGWQEAYIIGPQDPQLLREGWRYGFEGRGNDPRRQYCSVISHSPIRILAGPDDFIVTGFTPQDFTQVPLSAVGPFPKRVLIPIF